jgi:glycerophosphoryl diester phosphodiesterase
LREAQAWGVRLVEADVRLFRGRAEIRHLKSVGPLPLYWDRWQLASPFRRGLRLEALLAAAPDRPELVLDLKGRNRRLADLVLDALRPYPDRRVTVCARSWELLEPFGGSDRVRLVHSVGTAAQLRAFRSRFAGGRADGISIHAKLLDAETVRELRALAGTVMSWPVNTAERARELVAWGVDGLITDVPATLEVAAAKPQPLR